MTENQEKQIFKILNNLVIGVNAIREELDVIKADIVEIKADIVEIRADIADIRSVQAEQAQSLRRLEEKTDSIALEVADNGRRIDALERRTEQSVH